MLRNRTTVDWSGENEVQPSVNYGRSRTQGEHKEGDASLTSLLQEIDKMGPRSTVPEMRKDRSSVLPRREKVSKQSTSSNLRECLRCAHICWVRFWWYGSLAWKINLSSPEAIAYVQAVVLTPIHFTYSTGVSSAT